MLNHHNFTGSGLAEETTQGKLNNKNFLVDISKQWM